MRPNRSARALAPYAAAVVVGAVAAAAAPAAEPAAEPAAAGSLAPLPEDFFYGCGTSAYQIEGAWDADGKGPSIWDTFVHERNSIGDNSTGDVAADHYYRYREDVELFRNLGVDRYAFTISWSRVLPDGRGVVSQKGLQFYSDLVDELLSKGIQPIVTLYHWDCPQKLQDEYGCFLDPKIVDDFKNYARIIYDKLADRVQTWVTMNEPAIFCLSGYGEGNFAPGRCSDRTKCPQGNSITEPYICAHNALNAHAAAVDVFRTEFKNKSSTQNGAKIGIIVDGTTSFPLDENSEEDKAAAIRSMDFFFGWIAGPIWNGDYPQEMKSTMGNLLPSFTDEQLMLLHGSSDFFAWDAYTSQWATPVKGDCDPSNEAWPSCVDTSQERVEGTRFGEFIGAPSHAEWLKDVPQGMSHGLEYIQRTFNPPEIYITENGVPVISESKLPMEQRLDDVTRVRYYNGYLREMRKAMEKGINVKGYVAWSCMDNFEWNDGLDTRFGLIHVDYTTQERTLKRSAYFLKDFFRDNRST